MTLERDAVPGLSFEVAGNARRFETFELFVNAVDLGAGGMRLECQYNRDLFDAQTVARWMSAFETLLARGCRRSRTRARSRWRCWATKTGACSERWNATGGRLSARQRVEDTDPRARPDARPMRSRCAPAARR